MDPLSISASVLTLIAAAVSTVQALNETVGRYKGRDKLLGRLQGGLTDLINILKSLEEVANDETPILGLLKRPVIRCAEVSHEFEDAMKAFSTESKMGFRDWTKMQFMRGDINEFIDTLADYKSTITIGLGTITMHASRVTQQVVTDYNEMVKDTIYNLEMRLQRIDERLTSFPTHQPTPSEDLAIDLHDEKAVTLQCLRICERASSYIESLADEQRTLQREALQQGAEHLLKQFEAQLMTQQTLSDSRDKLFATMGRLREHLDSGTFNRDPDNESETLRLQEEINNSKQCLEVCKEASNLASNQKIYIIGEAIAEEDADQVVVTTLADLFNVGVVRAKGRSMQLIGSMELDGLKQLSTDRYGSRFGAVGTKFDAVAVPPSVTEVRKADPSATRSNQVREDGSSETTYNRPSSNEVRKRRAGGEDGTK